MSRQRYPVRLALLVDIPVLGAVLMTLGNMLWGPDWCPDLGCDSDAPFLLGGALAVVWMLWSAGLVAWFGWTVYRAVALRGRPRNAAGGLWVAGSRSPRTSIVGAALGSAGVAVAWVTLTWDCQSIDCHDLVQSARWIWGVGAVIWAMSWWSRWPVHVLVGAVIAWSAALATLVAA